MAGGLLFMPEAPPLRVADDKGAADPEIASVSVDAVPASPLFLYLLTCCSTIGGFLFGYDTGVISGALVLLKSPAVFDLSSVESESVVSAAVFGAIVGALLGSCGNHALGRKPVILASSTMFTVGSLLMGAASSFAALLVGRLVVGLGIGLSSMTIPLYIAEVSPPHIRGRLVSMNTLLITGGQFFACLLSAILSEVPDGWRYMLGLAAVPAAIQVLGFLLLPESPRYLLSRGRKQDAWKALVRIRGTEEIEHEFNHIESEVHKQQEHEVLDSVAKEAVADDGGDGDHARVETVGGASTGIMQLWGELHHPAVRRALVLGCVLQGLQQLCGINTVMYYGATIIQLAGFSDPSTAIWLAAGVSFSNFLFTFVGIYLVDRVGRRLLTLASLAGVFFSLVALGVSFYSASQSSMPAIGVGTDICGALTSCFDCVANADCGFCQGDDTSPATTSNACMTGTIGKALVTSSGEGGCAPSRWHYSSCPGDSPTAGWVILVALFVYLACFASGMGCMPWTVNAEIYPLRVRSIALSAATSVNWVANLLVSFTFLSVIDAFQPYGAFWGYAAIAAVGFVFLFCEMPETKGLALEEIQQIFERSTRYEKIDEKAISVDAAVTRGG